MGLLNKFLLDSLNIFKIFILYWLEVKKSDVQLKQI